MGSTEVAAIAVLIFAVAILYSSVGHAGASGYLAIMALFGVAGSVMKPTSLVLNILVASIAVFQFSRAGFFSWRTLWPFLVGSVPLAFVGAAVSFPGDFYRPLVGAVLLFAALRLISSPQLVGRRPVREPPVALAAGSGGVIGLLSGLTGTGGGIFLSPLLLFTRWADTRDSGGVAAGFILANSISGLLGHVSSVRSLPVELLAWAPVAGIGALIGTELGVRRFAAPVFGVALGAVLVVAGLKLILV